MFKFNIDHRPHLGIYAFYNVIQQIKNPRLSKGKISSSTPMLQLCWSQFSVKLQTATDIIFWSPENHLWKRKRKILYVCLIFAITCGKIPPHFRLG